MSHAPPAVTDNGLRVRTGQYSSAGRKDINQDFHGLVIPRNHQRTTKGIAVAIADGVSTSNVSHEASQAAVAAFLNDYYSTPDSWNVKQSAQRVLRATNAWLHAQTRQSQYRYDRDRGYICTLSVMVLKSAMAHLFHVGDTRIYRVQDRSLEQLTIDHSLSLAAGQSCLTRAMGLEPQVDIDYHQVPLAAGDLFFLATDGVYEHVRDHEVTAILRSLPDDLDAAARTIVETALASGSTDNLTVQLLRIEELPCKREAEEVNRHWHSLPFAPELQPGQSLDGYRVLRRLHASGRSHVYLAVDQDSGTEVVIKCPASDLKENPLGLELFHTEEWVARRISSPHVVRPHAVDRPRSFRYLVTVFVAGQTLKQWMTDHPAPDLETVRSLLGQIGKGLRAFHRLAMVHQDLKPENILVDAHGTVTLIDFGATQVAGLQELRSGAEASWPRGAALYSAPENFLGEPGNWLSDQFALGVIGYQMLTGHLPYGVDIPKTHTLGQQRRLRYRPIAQYRQDIPTWVDRALARAVSIEPHRRYPALSEFLFDLRQPRPDWRSQRRPALIERHPVGFWQTVSALLLAALLVSLALRG